MCHWKWELIDVYWKSCILNVANHSADNFGTNAVSRNDCKSKRCLFLCLCVRLVDICGSRIILPLGTRFRWVISLTARPLCSKGGKDPPARIGYKANWSSEAVCTIYRKEQSVTLTDIGLQMLGWPSRDAVSVLNILPRLTSQIADLHKRHSLF